MNNTNAMAVRAAAPQLTRSMRVGDAFRAVANNCIGHIAGNREGVAALDGESVHQMRVALRRWKSACRLFREVAVLPPELQADIAWLAGELGPARDWDVLANATLPAVARGIETGDRADLAPLTELREAAQETARQRFEAAATAASSPRYATLIGDLGAWADGLASGEQPIAEFAREAIRRDRKRLAKRARRLPQADAAARHRVRIAAKKCRYDTEFFLSLHDCKRWRRYLRRLADMQDLLGALNDAVVARELLTPLAGTPTLAAGAGFVQGFLSAGKEAEAKQVKRLWRRLAPMRLRLR